MNKKSILLNQFPDARNVDGKPAICTQTACLPQLNPDPKWQNTGRAVQKRSV